MKLLQVTSLISSDGFMKNFNISTDDFLERLREYYDFWQYDQQSSNKMYVQRMLANWSAEYEANLTQVLHPKGFCFTFNFPNASEFYHLEK